MPGYFPLPLKPGKAPRQPGRTTGKNSGPWCHAHLACSGRRHYLRPGIM